MDPKFLKSKKLLQMRGSMALVVPKEWLSLLGIDGFVEIELDMKKQRIIIRKEEDAKVQDE
jgi:bifunctional DNA-binding transcriptional regulator/antitoxin component of YhaV-PrlF toxin-antitoxin module